MNKTTLKREGEKWVKEEIITEEQLERLLAKYPSRDPKTILLIFAILLMGIGFLTFIFSDWAQQAHFSRLLVVIVTLVVLYGIGDYFQRKQSELLGVSFISLGYIVFGAGLFLSLYIYEVQTFIPWPFVLWGLVGLLLFLIYEHPFLFVLSISVTTIGQIYSGIFFFSFCWLLFLMLLFGFGHFVYHRRRRLYTYTFGISFLIQMLTLISVKDYYVYWLIVFYLALYALGELTKERNLRLPLQHTALLGIFLYNVFQGIILQDNFYFENITLELSFFLVWLFAFGFLLFLKFFQKESYSHIDLILFLPVLYLSTSTSIFTLILLFAFSLGWLIVGYKIENNEKIVIGTIAFLISTLTTYSQYAWDQMNKSLFFLIGGALLFVLSALLEHQRRKVLSKNGSDGT